MFFCQRAQKDKYLTVEATTLKYMHRVRRSHRCIEIMTCRHRADIYEAKVFMTFGPRSAQTTTTTTSTNTHHSLVHNRTKLKNSGLSQPLFALFDPYIIYIIYNFNKEPVCCNQLRRYINAKCDTGEQYGRVLLCGEFYKPHTDRPPSSVFMLLRGLSFRAK